jgi:hypothetical protein
VLCSDSDIAVECYSVLCRAVCGSAERDNSNEYAMLVRNVTGSTVSPRWQCG